MRMHCENHCTWRGDEDELMPDPDQSDDEADEHGTRYVCPVCGTNGALVEDWDEEAEEDESDGALQAAVRRAESAECLLEALRKADDERTGQLRMLSARYTGRAFAERLDEILEETRLQFQYKT